MEKSTIKKLLIGTVVTVLVVCLLVVSGIFLNLLKERKEEKRIREYENARQRITIKTEVVVPDDAEIVYHYYNGPGEYIQYTCFKFTELPTEFLEENLFEEEINERLEADANHFYKYKREPVPDEYKINFDNRYSFLAKGTHFLIFVPDKLMLIVYLEVW